MFLLVSEETDRHNCTNLGDWEKGKRVRGKKESTEDTKNEEIFKKQRSMEKKEERQTDRERETLENELKNCSYTNISTRAHAHTHMCVCICICIKY